MEDIMKLVKSLEESGFLVKGSRKRNKNEVKEQKWGFLPMLLGTLVASILGIALVGQGVIKAGEDPVRAGENF